MEKPAHSGHLWLWGVMTGLVLGMLFAPKKGSILRSQLSKAGSEGIPAQANLLKDELAKMLQDMLQGFQKLRENKQVHKLLGQISDYTQGADDQSI